MSVPARTAPMTVDEFLAWLEEQPEGLRYELVVGEPVAMAPERAAHARLKARVWRALSAAIEDRGLPCEALPDGMTVKIDEHTAYEPDALVQCGEPLPDDAQVVPQPLIVVEVLSPSTRGRDAGAKLDDYFRLPSVRHYLLVKTERRAVIHHRGEGGTIETRVVTAGALRLDPPAGPGPGPRRPLRAARVTPGRPSGRTGRMEASGRAATAPLVAGPSKVGRKG